MMSNYGIISRALFSEKPKLFTFEMIHSDGHGKSMKVVSLDPKWSPILEIPSWSVHCQLDSACFMPRLNLPSLEPSWLLPGETRLTSVTLLDVLGK